MTTYTVSTVADLLVKAGIAVRGDTILLTPGTYSQPNLQTLNPSGSGVVTVTAQDPNNPPLLQGLDCSHVQNFTFSHLNITTVGSGDTYYGCRIANCTNVILASSLIHGTLGTVLGNISGVYVSDGTNTTLSDNVFSFLLNGIVHARNAGLTMLRNAFHDVQIDAMTGGGNSSNFVVSNNTACSFYPQGQIGGTGDHPDFIQFFTTGATAPIDSLTITNNLFVRCDGSYIQGVFVNDEASTGYTNVTISGNLIAGGLFNGIFAEGVTNLTMANNQAAGFPDQSSWRRLESDISGTSTNNAANVLVTNNSPGVTITGDYVIAPITDQGKALVTAFVAANPTNPLPAAILALIALPPSPPPPPPELRTPPASVLAPKRSTETVLYTLNLLKDLGADTIKSFTLTVTTGSATLGTETNAGVAVTVLISGGGDGETSTFQLTVVTFAGQTLVRNYSLFVADGVRAIVPSTSTKRFILVQHWAAMGLSPYEFDPSPEEYAAALDSLDIMMAELAINALDLGYNFAPTLGGGDLDDPSGIPDFAVNFAALLLAQRVAPFIGKTLSKDTIVALARATSAVRTKMATIPEYALPFKTPVGAGNKPWSTWFPFQAGNSGNNP